MSEPLSAADVKNEQAIAAATGTDPSEVLEFAEMIADVEGETLSESLAEGADVITGTHAE
jgi:hypothetical protein